LRRPRPRPQAPRDASPTPRDLRPPSLHSLVASPQLLVSTRLHSKCPFASESSRCGTVNLCREDGHFEHFVYTPRRKRACTGTSSASQVHAISDRQRSEARGVVERYWTGSHTERYSLLTENYRERLERLDIRDAETYANQVQHPERVWKKRTYQRINVTFQKGRLVAQVAVLAQWEQEGYQGVMTYIFDLVREGDAWKIDFIMH